MIPAAGDTALLRDGSSVPGHWPPCRLAAVVLGVNLLPAFGPPGWAILVWSDTRAD